MILDIARLLLFPALMAFAATSDLLTMTISNRVSLALAAGFLVLALMSGMAPYDMLMHVGAGAAVRLASTRRILYPKMDLAGGTRRKVSGRAAREGIRMANVVVVGSQWGDEGKGKIVDWLSEQADIVVRFQGGHNAGHTLVIDGVTYKLSLLPSGVVRGGKLSIIGNGVVVDPRALIDEIAQLKKQGVAVTPDNLRIA